MGMLSRTDESENSSYRLSLHPFVLDALARRNLADLHWSH